MQNAFLMVLSPLIPEFCQPPPFSSQHRTRLILLQLLGISTLSQIRRQTQMQPLSHSATITLSCTPSRDPYLPILATSYVTLNPNSAYAMSTTTSLTFCQTCV
uniref:Uncharacterized protein n=1 Tax=Compsopogon caeruleus TaxID=31354 RepID=A0A7S1TCV3_9RHOD